MDHVLPAFIYRFTKTCTCTHTPSYIFHHVLENVGIMTESEIKYAYLIFSPRALNVSVPVYF